MASPKPRCKREIIKELYLEGLSTPDIAERADTSVMSVRSVLSKMRRSGEIDAAAPRTTLTKAIDHLDANTVRALREVARKRKTSPSELVTLIIRTALRDNLVAAILDDKEPDT